MAQLAENRVLNLNILRQCREQMALPLEVVRGKVGPIADIEAGKEQPTREQLYDLSDMYEVPYWALISESLPEEFRYSRKPSFRSFGNSKAFSSYRVRQLVARVEFYRDLLIELCEDIEDPMEPFRPPALPENDIKNSAKIVRRWLGLGVGEHLEFSALRERVEKKELFVFQTAKFSDWRDYGFRSDWSYIGDNGGSNFRALAIAEKTAPVIIINNTDYGNARSLPLLHEFAHLLRGDMNITGEPDSEAECWCNRLAVEILMPKDSKHWPATASGDFFELERLADKFKVGEHDCLMRLKELNRISPGAYPSLEAGVREKQRREHLRHQEEQSKEYDPNRDECKEVIEQFGLYFVRAILTAWHAGELSVVKTAQLLNLQSGMRIYDLVKLV